MNLVRRVHNAPVHGRRVRVLARHHCELIPANVSVLELGRMGNRRRPNADH